MIQFIKCACGRKLWSSTECRTGKCATCRLYDPPEYDDQTTKVLSSLGMLPIIKLASETALAAARAKNKERDK